MFSSVDSRVGGVIVVPFPTSLLDISLPSKPINVTLTFSIVGVGVHAERSMTMTKRIRINFPCFINVFSLLYLL